MRNENKKSNENRVRHDPDKTKIKSISFDNRYSMTPRGCTLYSVRHHVVKLQLFCSLSAWNMRGCRKMDGNTRSIFEYRKSDTTYRKLDIRYSDTSEASIRYPTQPATKTTCYWVNFWTYENTYVISRPSHMQIATSRCVRPYTVSFPVQPQHSSRIRSPFNCWRTYVRRISRRKKHAQSEGVRGAKQRPFILFLLTFFLRGHVCLLALSFVSPSINSSLPSRGGNFASSTRIYLMVKLCIPTAVLP